MRRPSPPGLDRILERLAALSPPRHRDLVRAMAAELQAIADPAERRRFALGAIAAILRLALTRSRRAADPAPIPPLHSGPRGGDTYPGDPRMTELSTRQLLRRHVIPSTVTFALLTILLLANSAARLWPRVSAREDAVVTFFLALLYAMPAIVALTIPMTVLVSVAWVFTRLGREGVLAAAQREPHGIRRLMRPVIGASAVLVALTLVLNMEVLPRANGQYTALFARGPIAQTDRSMTLGELREAARNAVATAGSESAGRAAAIRVEIQKKFALAAASLVLALVGAAIALRFPHGGRALALGASAVVFTGYYVLLVTGEALADQQVVPPFVGMWMTNVLLLGVVVLLVWRSRGRGGRPADTLALGG